MEKIDKSWGKKMEESFWSSMYIKFEVCGSLVRERPRKIWSEVVRQDLERWKVSKELANDRNV